MFRKKPKMVPIEECLNESVQYIPKYTQFSFWKYFECQFRFLLMPQNINSDISPQKQKNGFTAPLLTEVLSTVDPSLNCVIVHLHWSLNIPEFCGVKSLFGFKHSQHKYFSFWKITDVCLCKIVVYYEE